MRSLILALLLNVTNRATTAILFILLGRMIGPADAGVFTLGLSYMLIAGALAVGLDDLLIREASRVPEETGTWFVNIAWLRALISIVLVAGIALVVASLDYVPRTTWLVIALGTALFPEGLMAVGNSILIARRRLGMALGLAALIALFRIGGAIAVLLGGMDLPAVIVVFLAGSWLAALLFMFAGSRELEPQERIRYFKLDFCVQQMRQIAPFLLIGFLSTLEYQLDILFLSVFKGETEVGWYSSSTTFMWILWMVPVAYRTVYYPILARYARESPAEATQLYWRSVRYLLILALPIVVITSLAATRITELVYGMGFEPGGSILAIIVWAVPFVYIAVPNVRILLAYDQQRITGQFLLLNLGVNVAANLVLIPCLGGVGAAISRVLSSVSFWVFSWIRARRFVLPPIRFPLLLSILLAGATCAVVVWIVRDESVVLAALAGTLSYVGLLYLTGGLPDELLDAVRHRLARKLS